jgi:hypothetical protein
MAVGLVFAWSFVGKARDVPGFERTIARFDLLPKSLQRLAALAALAGELAVALTMLAGGAALAWGFGLAALLLLAFCVALAAALARKIETACNCFGASERPISPYDLLRNAGFTACALGGCGLAGQAAAPLGWLEWALAGATAGVFVIVWAQVGEIAGLFR